MVWKKTIAGALICVKKLVFLLLRSRQEIAYYEAVPNGGKGMLRVLHSGNENRGRDFIERLFGFLPEKKVIGRRFLWSIPDEKQLDSISHDVMLLESNPLCAQGFRRKGFFVVPEWVEFGREVVVEPRDRFRGASSALKGNLKKIRSSGFEFDISRKITDFNRFYHEMYLPYVTGRFGDSSIVKTRKKLLRDFQAGFLFILSHNGKPVAGSVVKVDRDQVTGIVFGVLDGAEYYLREGVSGVYYYYLLEWAAQNRKSFMNMGHTRPFPRDGVYRFKRKWLMSVFPDGDGVMTMGVKIRRWDAGMAAALNECPFVFQGPGGLGVFCVHNGSESAGLKDVKKLSNSYSTKGLSDLVIISTAGFDEDAYRVCRCDSGIRVHLFTNFQEAIAWQNRTALVN